jgi:sigma-B regulation protein RsbU (phosphoserine phosphatase)
MREAIGHDMVGQKCYEFLGRNSPCCNCVSRYDDENCSHVKEEVINDRVFSVSSSPLKNAETGDIDGVIEVLHDITEIKKISSALERQNERLRNDLSMARRLQYSLLPNKHLAGETLDFSFIYKPCDMLGGDFLDIYKIDESHFGIYIADVSGHGVAASMLTMFLRAAIDKSSLSPAKVLNALNRDFNKNGFEDNLYIALFYGILDISNYTITYSNAGLNVCPIVYGKDNFEILRASGIPISTWIENPIYTEKTISFKPKDRMFFYTDGIIEIRNEEKEQFGEDRIVDHLLNSDLSTSDTLLTLIDKAYKFLESSNQKSIMDDITVALIEIKK